MTAYSYFLAQKEAKTTYFHSFSGAENEPRDIHPLQGLPLYGEDATQENAETDIFLPFWYRGTRDEFFIGWRMEGAKTRLVLLIGWRIEGAGTRDEFFIGWRIENGQKCLEGHIGEMGPGK